MIMLFPVSPLILAALLTYVPFALQLPGLLIAAVGLAVIAALLLKGNKYGN